MIRRGRKFLTLKDKVRLPAEVLGTAKPPFLWNLILYPAKRGAVKQILTSSIDSVRIQPLRAPRNTKEPFTIQPFVQIRVVRGSRLGNYTRSFLDHLLLAARKFPAFTRPITSARTQLLSAQLASPQCESPLSGGTLKGRMVT